MAQATRRAVVLLFLLVVVLSETGCWVYSVQPLAESDADIVFDRLLLGNWWMPKSGCTVTFSHFYDERSYRVVYAAPPQRKDNGCLLDEGYSAVFEGKLVEIGGMHFLDLYPADREAQHHEALLHSFYRVQLAGNTFTATPMNPDWVKSQVEEQKFGVTGRADRDRVVLTMSTKDLREFLRVYGSEDQLFPTAARQQYERRPGV